MQYRARIDDWQGVIEFDSAPKPSVIFQAVKELNAGRCEVDLAGNSVALRFKKYRGREEQRPTEEEFAKLRSKLKELGYEEKEMQVKPRAPKRTQRQLIEAKIKQKRQLNKLVDPLPSEE